jgi:hypothetical protein
MAELAPKLRYDFSRCPSLSASSNLLGLNTDLSFLESSMTLIPDSTGFAVMLTPRSFHRDLSMMLRSPAHRRSLALEMLWSRSRCIA